MESVGAAALAALEAAGEEAAVFKRPLVPKGRVKKRTLSQVVLDEEAYTRELAHIIERDFFPDLAESRQIGQQDSPAGLSCPTAKIQMQRPEKRENFSKNCNCHLRIFFLEFEILFFVFIGS